MKHGWFKGSYITGSVQACKLHPWSVPHSLHPWSCMWSSVSRRLFFTAVVAVWILFYYIIKECLLWEGDVCMHAPEYMWRSAQLEGVGSLLPSCKSGDQTQVFRLGSSKFLFPKQLNHLTCSSLLFLGSLYVDHIGFKLRDLCTLPLEYTTMPSLLFYFWLWA